MSQDLLNEWNRLVTKVEILYKRLGVEVSGLSCSEILRHALRINVLEKNIRKLEEEERRIRREYYLLKQSIRRYEFVTKRIIRTGSILIALLAAIMALTTLENTYHILPLPPELSYIFENPSTFPTILVSGASLIVLTVIVMSFFWTVIARKYDINKLKQQDIELRRKYYNDVLKRLNILKREMEQSTSKLTSRKTFSICKCYEEYNILYNVVKNLSVAFDILLKCRDLDCVRNTLEKLSNYLKSLGNIQKVCDSRFTDEYYLRLETRDDLPELVKVVVDKPYLISELKIKVITRKTEYVVDLGKIISGVLKSISRGVKA